jgi:predicted cupin superfamily sugar epimerase
VDPADPQHWIRALALTPHPEGGWFRETYRSVELLPAAALPPRFGAPRPVFTSILYMLAAGECSRFHRLKADELWWHHAGGELWLHLLEPGAARRITVGPGTPQALVPHGTWFAAEPAPGCAAALVGCGVAPGFEYEDFELAERRRLLMDYPEQRDLVLRFTSEPEAPAWP